MHLQNNKLGPNFIKNILNSLKYDEYIRVLDLRKNLFSTTLLEDTTTFDFVKSLQRNESITNIDLRGNQGFNKTIKFKLSLLMIRNIDKLRENGILVHNAWINRNILMLNETINSTLGASRVNSPGNKEENSDGDSIFNIELSNQALKQEVKSSKKLMSATYQTKSSKKSVVPKGLVNKQKARPPSTKGPIKATLEIKAQPGGFHLDDRKNFNTYDDLAV